MSVTQDTQLDWDDVLNQSIRLEYAVDSTNLDGSTGEMGGSTQFADDTDVIDVADGLARDEVAELLGYDATLTAFVGSIETDPGEVRTYLAMGTDEGDLVTVREANNGAADTQDFDHNVNRNDPVSETSSLTAVLFVLEAIAGAAIEDEGNGAGLGGFVGQSSRSRMFLQNEYGFRHGPTFRSEDALSTSVVFQPFNLSSGSVHADLTANLYWRIHTVDRETI